MSKQIDKSFWKTRKILVSLIGGSAILLLAGASLAYPETSAITTAIQALQAITLAVVAGLAGVDAVGSFRDKG